MMRDGGDVQGLWQYVRSGMQYEEVSSTIQRTPLTAVISSGVIFEHLSWVSYYAKHIPALVRNVLTLRRLGISRAQQRYQQGSTSKDLFYYLVSRASAPLVRPAADASLRATRTTQRRSRPRLWLSHPRARSRSSQARTPPQAS